MKTILHVFSSFEIGGSQRRFADLMKLKIANNQTDIYRHQILALDGNYEALSLLPVSDNISKSNIHIKENLSFITQILTIRRALKEANFDLIASYNWGSTMWSLANRFLQIAPHAHIQDGFGPEENQHEIKRRRMLRRIAYGGKCHVIVPSLQLKKLAEESWDIQQNKLHYIPNGIDLKRHSKSQDNNIRKQLGLRRDQKVIGTVCALRPEKNVGRLIEAFAKIEHDHPDTRLLIVGDGTAMPAMQMLATRTGLADKIIFVGHQDAPENYIAAMDIFALSSDTEQMPLSVIEAMAAGKVIAATNVGDIKNMVCTDNKSYIKGRDASSLAVSISHLLTMDQMAQKIGANNTEKCKTEFQDQVMYERWKAIFDQLSAS